MAITIRPFVAATDAEQVARLFNSAGYGPMETGKSLTAATLVAALEARESRLFLVADNGERILGTSGYARMSRRRVAPEGELYGGMFLVDPSMRAGVLAGRLFLESFEWALSTGVRTLRVEVDPSNTRALPIYIRGGFRMIGDGAPDEDGFVELVSHLPGVTAALRAAYPDDVPERDSWRAIRSRRQDSITTGVYRAAVDGAAADGADDGWRIDYTFEVRDSTVVASVDAQDGRLLGVTIDEVPQSGFGSEPAQLPNAATAPREHRLGDFVVRLDHHGAMSIHHPDHFGPLLSDPFPVLDGTPAGGWRPAARAVSTSEDATGWLTTNGEVTRLIAFDASTVSVRLAGPAGRRITAYPVSGVRVAEVSALTADGRAELAHAVLGEWPPDMPGFTPAGAPSPSWTSKGLQIGWIDRERETGFRIACDSDGHARMDGQHAVILTGSGAMSYTVAPQAPLSAVAPVEANPAAATSGGAVGSWTSTTYRQEPAHLHESVLTEAGVLVNQSGVAEWRTATETILDAATLRRRTFGPFAELPAPIWVTTQPERTPWGAARWALPDERLPFVTELAPVAQDAAGNGWTIIPSPQYDALDVVVRMNEPVPSETAVYLRAGDRGSAVEVTDSGGSWRRIGPSKGRWRTWTRSARVSTAVGLLEVTPLAGSDPEILVRSTPAGVLLTLFARTGPTSIHPTRWRIRQVPSAQDYGTHDTRRES